MGLFSGTAFAAGDTTTPNYLTFTALEDGSSVTFDYASAASVQYKLNDNDWAVYVKGTKISLDAGDSVAFKGTDTFTTDEHHFSMEGKIAASGDVTSLTNGTGGDVSLANYAMCYGAMFDGCKALTTAPNLPSTTLSTSCYTNMFEGCTSLTKAPALPATALEMYCYHAMFKGCTSLEEMPALRATALPISCYQSMFEGCTNLIVYEDNTHEGYRVPWSVPEDDNLQVTDMLKDTAGDDIGTPVAKTVYYVKGIFNVKWMTQDGSTELSFDQVDYGTAPVYGGTEPTKDEDACATYDFAGWSTETGAEVGTAVENLPAVEGDTTYYAAFSKTAKPATYDVENGDSGTWTKDSGENYDIDITKTPADDSFIDGLTGVQIDGTPLVQGTDYVVGSGDSTVTLKPETLQKLDEGDHAVTVTFNDGGQATFTLGIKLSSNKGSKNDDSTTGNSGTVNTSPKTGDNGNIGLWFALLVTALVALGGAVVFVVRRKRRG